MALYIQVTVTGGKELKSALKEKSAKVNEKLIDAIERGCTDIESEARHFAPVEFGYLRANIIHELIADKSPVFDKEINIFGKVGVRDIVDYAEAVEVKGIKGTARPRKPGKKMPYLLPAFNKFTERINNDIAKALVEGLNEK